ncbi:MAG: accessory gene regulator B family protein [Clostridiaceae bacterium]|nr:accessory gene regulator B family protein [Clostridiaceae bacterium]
MKYFANLFTNKLVVWNIIKSDDRELYAYGFWQGTILIVNFITVVIIGLLCHMLWQSLIFMLAYGVLRPVAGGYHARTQRNCYIFSILLLLAVLALLHQFPWNAVRGIFAAVVATCIVFLLAPVEDENKPLDKIEQLVYKRRSRWTSLLLLCITIILMMIGKSETAYCIAVAIMALAVMLVLGKLKNMVTTKSTC